MHNLLEELSSINHLYKKMIGENMLQTSQIYDMP